MFYYVLFFRVFIFCCVCYIILRLVFFVVFWFDFRILFWVKVELRLMLVFCGFFSSWLEGR